MRRSLIFVFALGACAPTTADGGDSTSGDEARDVAANQNAPPPESYVAPGQTSPSANAGAGRPPSGSGTQREDPVRVCGPVESYRYVADYRCPGGEQPLGGDPALGQRARVGNVGGNASGHIIDLYRVPCASGDVDVFIDMYGCAEMESLFSLP